MTSALGADAPARIPICGWMAECDPRFRQELLAVARPLSCPAGSVLYRAGETGGNLYGIRTGVVSMQCRFVHPDAVLSHMLRSGDWFGTFAVLADKRRRVTAEARTDVNLVRVPGSELQALLNRHPRWLAELGRDALGWVDIATQGAADLLIRDSTARCAAVLLRMAGRRWATDSEAEVPSVIPASQSELAGLCNVSRKTFSRILSSLSKRGLVAVGYKSVTVADPLRLRRLADGAPAGVMPPAGRPT